MTDEVLDIRDHDDAGSDPPLRAALEAILLVVDEPVSENELAQVVEADRTLIRQTLVTLAAEYRAEGRGFELREVGGGWRFYSAEACSAYVERFVVDAGAARLTQAALETLAIVAYRQPVSRGVISAIRGVNVDAVVRTLVSRGLVTVVAEESGVEQLATTTYFLERLGLSSLGELPNLAPLVPALSELDAEV